MPSPVPRYAPLLAVLLGGVLGCLLGAVPAASQPGESPPVAVVSDASDASMLAPLTSMHQRQVVQARDRLFDGRMNAAARGFRGLESDSWATALGRHGLLTMAFYQAAFSERDDAYTRFGRHADTLSQVLGDVPDGPRRDLLEAEKKLMEAIVSGRRGNYLSGAWTARSAFKQFQSIHEAAPNLVDAEFGLGLLHLVIGVLPSSYQRLLEIIGFDGDATRGIKELERVAAQGTLNRTQATMVLAITDLMLYERGKEAVDRLGTLYTSAPESVVYAYLYGFALLTNRQGDAAASVLEDAVERASASDVYFVDYLDFYLGTARLYQQRYAEAQMHFSRYLGRHGGDALKAKAYLQLGRTIELQGDWESARHYYALVGSSRDYDSDRAAARRAADHVERPMTDVELRLLKARLAYDGGRDEDAVDLIRGLLGERDLTADERAEARYRLARTYHSQGEEERALALYHDVRAAPGDARSKWGPYSLLYTGDVRAAQGRADAARKAYRAALDWPTPFDFHESLEQTAELKLKALSP